MLNFNPDGSLKLTSGQVQQKEEENRSITITKEQISEKPAKAQLRIRFPEDVLNPGELIHFYSRIDKNQFRSVDHSIDWLDGRTLIIRVDVGSMLMYSFLNLMTDCFRDKLSEKGKVIVRGSWSKTVY